jgi:hypothetical protein
MGQLVSHIESTGLADYGYIKTYLLQQLRFVLQSVHFVFTPRKFSVHAASLSRYSTPRILRIHCGGVDSQITSPVKLRRIHAA